VPQFFLNLARLPSSFGAARQSLTATLSLWHLWLSLAKGSRHVTPRRAGAILSEENCYAKVLCLVTNMLRGNAGRRRPAGRGIQPI